MIDPLVGGGRRFLPDDGAARPLRLVESEVTTTGRSWRRTRSRTTDRRRAASSMPAVRELQAGVWHWEAPHPDWKPGEEWDEIVSSYAIDDGERLLLFDPLGLPSRLEERAGERETAIVLTCPWHARDARSLAERLGVPIHVPPPDDGDPDPVPGEVFREGERLPVGVEAFRGMEANDLVLWVGSHGAIVAGDSLIDRGNGLEIPVDWVGAALDQVRESLRSLLERRVELVLATHGGPADRAALERALA